MQGPKGDLMWNRKKSSSNCWEAMKRYDDLVSEYNALLEESALREAMLYGILETSPIHKNKKCLRGINIILYFSNGNHRKVIIDTFDKIFKELNLYVDLDIEKRGSIFKRIMAVTKDLVTHKEVKDKVKKIERHIENKTVNKSQVELDVNLASAISQLLESTKEEESIIQFGSFIIVRKFGEDGKLKNMIRTLTTTEELILTNNQELYKHPKDFFDKLGEEVRKHNEEVHIIIKENQ
ncbi:hypothetical protein [Arcobacter sp. CECT 8989]|uniref:hypothetical protein n=1 Tax=Arcobacter sp. CECT 8989 TaxID=2044509 RepID=UPI00100B5391|nr:hypothetical protein [Arcobacter sp. CECT 8989]